MDAKEKHMMHALLLTAELQRKELRRVAAAIEQIKIATVRTYPQTTAIAVSTQ